MMEQAARLVARLAHRGQKYGDRSYVYHLDMVVQIVRHYQYPVESIVAAWLHDVLEDTDVSYEELKSSFGPKVSVMVEGCTGRGKNRKERQANINGKLVRYRSSYHVKLADRMANLHVCFSDPTNKLTEMYLREDAAFRAAFIGDISQDVRDEQWKDYLQMVETRQPLAFVVPLKAPGTYEPSLSKIGEAFNVGEEPVLAPGVRGYAVEDEGLIKIPLIYAEKEGSGDVGRFLDSLSARCVIPSAFNPRLCGMLERRGFAPVWDGEVNIWRRDV